MKNPYSLVFRSWIYSLTKCLPSKDFWWDIQNKWFLRFLPSSSNQLIILRVCILYGSLFQHFLFSVLLVVHGADLTCCMSYFPSWQLRRARLGSPQCLYHGERWPYHSVSTWRRDRQELVKAFPSLPPPPPCAHTLHLCLVLCPIKTHLHEKIWLTHHTMIYKACCGVIPRCIWILTPDKEP